MEVLALDGVWDGRELAVRFRSFPHRDERTDATSEQRDVGSRDNEGFRQELTGRT